MTSILSLVLLFLSAYLGAQLFKKFRFQAFWMKGFGYSGILYILIGLLIGPKFLNIVNSENIRQLDILFAFVLGWAGFLIGLQSNITALKRFQRNHYWFASINFLLTFLITYLLLTQLKNYFFPEMGLGDILILSISGGVTSPILIAVISKEYRISGSISYLLRFNAAFDNIIGICVLGIFIALLSKVVLWNTLSLSLAMIGIMTGLSLLFALLYYFLSRQLKSEEEDRLLIISLLLFLMGTALLFGQSLLFTAFVFGAGLANLKISTKKLFLDIQNLEKPFYVLLLLYVGSSLDYAGTPYLILLFAFIIVHIIAKYTAGIASKTMVREEKMITRSVGLGNLGMGGLSLAIILDVHLLGTTEFTELLLFVVTISILLNDIISLWYLRGKAN